MANDLHARYGRLANALDGRMGRLNEMITPPDGGPAIPMPEYMRQAEQHALRDPEFAKQFAFALGQYQGRRRGGK
jgi:hypothetical protein